MSAHATVRSIGQSTRLAPVLSADGRDWRLTEGRPDGDYATIWASPGNLIIARRGSSRIRASFPGYADFHVDFERHSIHVHRTSEIVSDATIEHLLFDQIVPRIIAHGGKPTLHGSAVGIGSSALVFCGLTGQGKSTLAASFGQESGDLLGDDAVMVTQQDGSLQASAVYRSLRLFRDSIDQLFAVSPPVTPVADYTAKLRVEQPYDRHASGQPLPLAALFVLQPPQPALQIRRLGASESCMAILEHSFWLDPVDLDQARDRFRSAAAIARLLPVFGLAYPRDYRLLPAVRAAILKVVADLARPEGADA